MQKPYSWRSLSFSSLIFYKVHENIKKKSMRDFMMFGSGLGECAWMQAYLFLHFWHLFPCFWLGLEVLTHLTEVALVQVGDLWLLLWCHFLKEKRNHLKQVQLKYLNTYLNTCTVDSLARVPNLRLLNISHLLTFLQSLKKFFLKMSLVVYSWSNILAKNVATSSAEAPSFIALPTNTEKSHCSLGQTKWIICYSLFFTQTDSPS